MSLRGTKRDRNFLYFSVGSSSSRSPFSQNKSECNKTNTDYEVFFMFVSYIVLFELHLEETVKKEI